MSFDNYKIYRVGEITTWRSGGTPSKGNNEYWNGDIPWISAKTFKESRISDSDIKITQSGLIDGSRLAKINSILLLVRGSGLFNDIPIGIVQKPVAFNQDIKSIEVYFKVIDPWYFFYWLKANKPLLRDKLEHTGIGAGKLDIDILRNLEIAIPSLNDQSQIVNVVRCLDDKIELNNRINNILQEMAQAIFKSWFVDFEPFRDGEFEDSELGRIPKGWKVGRLDEIIELYDSKRVPLSSRQREGLDKIYPYYGATSIMDYVDKYIFDGTYVLLGEDGSVIDENEYPYLQYVWGKFWVNNHAHVIKGKNGFSEEYLYTLLKKTNVRSIITGAVQLKINQGNLCNLGVLIPARDVVEKFNLIAKDIFAMYRKNIEESRDLIEVRDSLLPKLMSGEIRVEVGESNE